MAEEARGAGSKGQGMEGGSTGVGIGIWKNSSTLMISFRCRGQVSRYVLS